jgi:hypothetical protein
LILSRYYKVLASYWALFIILPTLLVCYRFGTSGGMGILVVSVLIGERGFRPWKRLWKVGDGQDR